MRLGYGAENEDCEVRDNVIARGALSIEKLKTVVRERNIEKLPESKAIVIPNKYDPNRAHLVIFNGAKVREMSVPATSFLKPGDAFRIKHPRDFFGKPVLEGKCEGDAIKVPVHDEFAVLILLREAKNPDES